MQRLLFALDELLRIDITRIAFAIFLFFNAKNVGGALHTGQQILAIIGVEEFGQRFNPARDHQQIIDAVLVTCFAS